MFIKTSVLLKVFHSLTLLNSFKSFIHQMFSRFAENLNFPSQPWNSESSGAKLEFPGGKIAGSHSVNITPAGLLLQWALWSSGKASGSEGPGFES